MTFPEENNLEIWKPIPEYENYEVSTWGRVRNSDRKIIKEKETKHKYSRITISKKSKHDTFLIHRLVGINFIPNPGNLPQINHKDGNKKNNNIENLEWVTSSENIKHSFDTGLQKSLKGENVGNSKLTEIQVSELKKLQNEGWKQIDLAEKFGVSKGLISRIKNGKAWTHI